MGLVSDDLAYDADPHLHCLEPTQHSWLGTRPKLDQSPTSNGAQSHMATSMISLAKPTRRILGTYPLDPKYRPPLCFVGLPLGFVN